MICFTNCQIFDRFFACATYRAIFDKTHTVPTELYVKSEVEILEPVTVKIDLCQNMSAGWYHDKPDIDITGSMPSISVSFNF